MSAAGHREDDEGDGDDNVPDVDPRRAAATLRDAGFVRLVATADGDALAAVGLLARALRRLDVPFQASLAAVPTPPTTDADCTVAVGHPTGDVAIHTAPLSTTAAAVADAVLAGDADAGGDIDADTDTDTEADTYTADPALALAGAVCAGAPPAGDRLEAAGLERRPGVAIPTADPVTGLVGSTLVHAAFSGDEEATAAAIEGLAADPDDGAALASFVALSAVRDAPPRAAEAVECALRPYDCDRFETIGGFADVLDAVARRRPGTGIALAIGADVADAALDVWRDHGVAVHRALRTADTARYDGVFVARLEDADDGDADIGERDADADGRDAATLGAVARLLYAYRSPEPIALVAADGAAAVTAEVPVEGPFREATEELDGSAVVRAGVDPSRGGFHGTATVEGTASDYVAAFRRAL